MAQWEKRFIYSRPAEERVFLSRTPVPGAVCERCGESEIARYPAANHQGPRIITRCQSCFHIVSVRRPVADDMWPPFRAVAYDWEPSFAERRGRDEQTRD